MTTCAVRGMIADQRNSASFFRLTAALLTLMISLVNVGLSNQQNQPEPP